jgi:hypothetical protein
MFIKESIKMNQMKNLLGIMLTTMLIMSGCSSIKVHFDYDKSADFTRYKTFEFLGWAEESDKILNRFDKERIQQAFGNEFAKRNLEYVESNGDMAVSLFIVVDQKTSVTAYTNHMNMGGWGYGAGWGWHGGYGGVGMGTSTTTYSENDYLEGTLVVDVYDARTKKMVWQSVGQKTIDENPRNAERNIAYAAEKIMKPFPIEPVK